MDHFEICKIIGTANTKTWAQVHLFEPQEEEKKTKFGRLFAVFSLENKSEAEEGLLEITAFGKEILTRFHEIYFSAEELNSCQERLEKAFQGIQKEFSDRVIVSGAAGVILDSGEKKVLYLARLGAAQAYLWRDNQRASLLASGEKGAVDSASGWLEEGDVFALGTEVLFKLIPQDSFQTVLSLESLEQASQVLAPMVHGHQENALAALIMVGYPSAKKEEDEPKEIIEPKLSRFKFPSLSRFLPGRLRGSEKITVKLRQKMVYGKKSRKMAISVAVLFLILLIVSVSFGFKKKQGANTNRQEAQLLEIINYNLEQAAQLEELNPIRAKSLLTEAQDAFNTYQEENPDSQSQPVKEAGEKINRLLAQVSKEYQITEAEVFFDLSLIKDDFKAKLWGLTDEEAVILGQDAVVSLDLDKKQTQVIAGGEEAKEADFIGSVSAWAVLATDKELAVIDKAKQRAIDTRKLEEIEVTDLVGYAGNIYVLDSQSNQVWRYAGLSDGLAKPKEYFSGEPDLEGAVSLAIDASIWIMFNQGEIVKYTRGKQEVFTVVGLDKPFNQPIKLFTDENQDYLYILDHKNTRVVVIGKAGEYQAQYIWPGIAGATDVLASEELGKIFVLTESKVYGFEIRE